MIFELIFLLSFILLVYVYFGYLVILKLFIFCRGKSQNSSSDKAFFPAITVLITAYNEEKNILKRIDNILSCQYGNNNIEIIVASDGSTDNTDKIVRNLKESKVSLFRPKIRLGKTETQNLAIKKSKGEIIIFTDSETHFDKNFITNIVKLFSSNQVGCATGRLCFSSNSNAVSESQGFYWSYETQLREIESSLGILAVTSGACMAVRKSLFIPIDESYGEDCIVPLDIVINKHKVIYAKDAIAYDQIDSEVLAEVFNRSRMTLRNWQGTWSKSCILNPFKFPGYSFALWSHKILRWLSPIYIFLITISVLILSYESLVYFYVLQVMLLFYLLGLIGWLANKSNIKIPIASSVFSFLLANLGFLFGLLRVIKKERLKIYRT